MAISDLFQMLSSSASSPVIDFNEDYRLYNNTASSTDGISGFSLEKIRGFPWFDCQRNLAAICAVCLDGVHKGERSRNFSICKHVFHARCIDLWLVRRLTCPTCRSPFKMEPV
ncbi:hypothetical protein CISIN_1g038517mg [Citrus sinensis]|uniref:RING-type E3 ubiquitin transferase n=1 Tax=Citrus sinensis TaxID=2711 RepID=A0A067HA56_CITSI|nr:hypothetical protein CISIN_1g038517mg [Citrus sinensis]